MAKKIFGFTGLMACGKGTIAKYLKEKHGAATFRFSTPMRDLLDRLYLPQTRENMSNISRITRAQFGQDLYSKVIANDASNAESDIVVVEGIRRLEDVVELRKLPNFTLVAIDVDAKVRYERLRVRGENPDDNTKTWEQFLKDHELETEVTIPEVMEKADKRVDNNSDMDSLAKQLDELVK